MRAPTRIPNFHGSEETGDDGSDEVEKVRLFDFHIGTMTWYSMRYSSARMASVPVQMPLRGGHVPASRVDGRAREGAGDGHGLHERAAKVAEAKRDHLLEGVDGLPPENAFTMATFSRMAMRGMVISAELSCPRTLQKLSSSPPRVILKGGSWR